MERVSMQSLSPLAEHSWAHRISRGVVVHSTLNEVSFNLTELDVRAGSMMSLLDDA